MGSVRFGQGGVRGVGGAAGRLGLHYSLLAVPGNLPLGGAEHAARFSANSPNLLFMGHSGLGKTHLALAIADAVLEGGHDVLYTSAAALAAQLGKEHFDYTNNEEWLAACQEADLLILDDLGTEYITPLTISVLYELINTRMLTHRPTIYTTNIIDQNIFVARYTEKVASRMLGGCKMFKFFGEDQRLK